jgi:oxygen-independent coproporphyrinogen III oxidase
MTAQPACLDRAFLGNLPNVPRYTSYPPANHFLPGLGPKLLASFLSAIERSDGASLYIHIPYCDRLCWFCGCHTKHTLSYEPIRAYVRVLCDEIAMYRVHLGRKPLLRRIHLGGGSPSLLRSEELDRLKHEIDQAFALAPQAEISVEIDPSDCRADTIQTLADFGMNRASIGVQDFDTAVQQAINRPQSFELTRDVVDELRRAGVGSINIDALYGLPLQTAERLQSTIGKVLSLAPDRIALFGYAHVPSLKPHQRLIAEDQLPGKTERLSHAQAASRQICEAGYMPIGMDHFAVPSDGLAKTAQAGRLRRNFQGYTDDSCAVLIGLGASSISSFEGGYIQNGTATGRYTAAVTAGIFPHDRGFVLSEQDQSRAWIIERLMCDYRFSRTDLLERFGMGAASLWLEAQTAAYSALSDMASIRGEVFLVHDESRPFIRHIASAFDVYLPGKSFAYSTAV